MPPSYSPHFLPFSSQFLTHTIKPSLFSPTMKDRPPSSYGAVYVPPHHRLISSPNNQNATKNSSAPAILSKLRDHQNTPILNAKGTASPPSLPHLQQQQQQRQQQQGTYNNNNGSKNCNNQNAQYNSAYCLGISENVSDRQLDLSLQSIFWNCLTQTTLLTEIAARPDHR